MVEKIDELLCLKKFCILYTDEKIIKPETSSKERNVGKTVTPMLPAGFFKD